MSKFPEVLQNIIIGNRNPGDYYNRIFVVSAYSGVTNWLDLSLETNGVAAIDTADGLVRISDAVETDTFRGNR